MLAHRVIPTLLCRGRTLVKGAQFNSWRSVGNVAQAVRVHAARGVDELVLLDIGATPENRGPDLALIEELAGVMTTPLAVGGGIRTVEDVKNLLRHGADKVVIGTAAIQNPTLIPALRDAVGCQAVVIAIDVAGVLVARHCAKYLTDIPCVKWAQASALHGVGEILLTDVLREGVMNGYNLRLIRDVANVVDIPVIAHGGCGTYEHMVEAINAGADAVAAGAMFQFTDATPAGAAEYLAKAGVEVRRRAA